MKEWLAAMDRVSENAYFSALSGSAFGKSVIYDELAWRDNRSIWKINFDQIAEYKTEGYESATVVVIVKTRDAKDPRNPNPAARNATKVYPVMCGERQLGEYNAPALAKLQAQTFHKRLVDALMAKELEKLEDQKARVPNYGKF